MDGILYIGQRLFFGVPFGPTAGQGRDENADPFVGAVKGDFVLHWNLLQSIKKGVRNRERDQDS